MKYFVLLFLLVAACQPQNMQSISASENQQGIVGGVPVTNQGFRKHLVALYNVHRGNSCSASLIGPNLLLTAAHCLSGDADDHHVFFTTNALHPSIKATVTGYRIHPDFDVKAWTNRHDIAVVAFTGSLPQGYEPISLATYEVLKRWDKEFFAVGYGNTQARGNQSGPLRYANKSASMVTFDPEDNQFYVSQKAGYGICFGDSGGPALAMFNGRYHVIGVASAVFTKHKGDEKQPGYDICKDSAIYISVHAHTDWIRRASASL